MKPRINSRKKGSRNERDVCKVLKSWSNLDFTRTPSSGGLRWKKTDNITGDVVCTEPNYIFPFSIECKAYNEINFQHLLYLENTDIHKFWKQALEDSQRGKKIPLLLIRYNGLPKLFYFVIMRNSDLKIFKPYLKKAPIIRYSGGFSIMNPDMLFKSSYSKIEKLAKQIING